jgi:uncharacterized protein
MAGPALITGASEGIGRALAHVFARHRHPLLLTARNAERLESLAEEVRGRHGVEARCLPADLSDAGAPAALHETVQGLGVEVEYLVNNAGFGLYGDFLARDRQAHVDLVQVNVAALTELCHRFGAEMAARGHGRIVNVASVVAFLPGPMMSTYFASKAYVLRFSESLHEELGARGVSVTCLCPGRTESRFQERSGLTFAPRPGGGIATAEAVAEVGYQAMMAGRAIAFPGFVNKLMPLAERLLPRLVMRKAIHAVMRRRP